jgi:hypothetical protein
VQGGCQNGTEALPLGQIHDKAFIFNDIQGPFGFGHPENRPKLTYFLTNFVTARCREM